MAAIEKVDLSDEEIKAECLALNTYYNRTIDIEVFKITFIDKKVVALEEIKQLEDDHFLSNSIIVNYKEPTEGWRSYLFRSIVTVPRMLSSKFGKMPILNNYLHICNTFSCNASITDKERFTYKITGTYFCQQNTVTSVCAHAALCTIINNMNPPSKQITPEDINKIINVNHRDKKTEGLTKEQIETVLNDFGLTITWIDFFDNPNMEYNDYIYKYIESRCPTLLVFTTDNPYEEHVVPVLGHTLNSDLWRPEAEPAYLTRLAYYKSTSAWADHFIIHDDNFGMYYCLPIDTLKRVTLPKFDPNFRARLAVVVTPYGVTTPAWEAEWASIFTVDTVLDNLKKNGITLDVWSDRIVSSKNMRPVRPVVIRTLLINKDAYAASLEEKDFACNSFSQSEKDELIKDLPDHFWLSEITLPDLYTANRTKIIDFFYGYNYGTLTDEKELLTRWLQIRFPGVLVKNNAASLLSIPMGITSHYPLFRYQDEKDTVDW